MKKTEVYILDTSAILSGKPLDFEAAQIITTQSVSDELKPGGRDYRNFQFLKEKGLTIFSPSKRSLQKIKEIVAETGDIDRLSSTDLEILSLAYEMKTENKNPIILTDDFSIQNVAEYLKIRYESINQLKITKKFKWICRCRGCGKKFEGNIRVCPVCGTETKKIVSSEERTSTRECDT